MILLPAIALGQDNGSGGGRDNGNPCEQGNGRPKWCDSPLPVTVTSFTGQASGGQVQLQWKVALEVSHSHYEVESSSDTFTWFYAGSTQAHSISIYISGGHQYYRLISVDLDGTRHNHRIIFIKSEQRVYNVYNLQGRLVGVYPRFDLIPRGQVLIFDKQIRYIHP